MRPTRFGATVALALAVVTLAAGCGGSAKPTVTIGTRDTAEEEILGEIYAQALEGAGFTVEKNVNLGSEDAAAPQALEKGLISGYPDHLSSTFTNLLKRELDGVPPDSQKAYRKVRAGLERRGLTALPPTPFSFTNAVGALRKTAEQRHLKTVSGLKGQSEELTVAGVRGCHEQINCLEGLERLYGLQFAGLVYLSYVETEPFESLETGFASLGMLPNTDGRLARDKKRFVTLEEDKHLFPAGNAIFITTTDIADEAGPDFEAAIVAAQKGLTLPVMQELDAEVEIEHRDPAAVAAKYLKRARRRARE